MRIKLVLLLVAIQLIVISLVPSSVQAAQTAQERQLTYGQSVRAQLAPDEPAHEWRFSGRRRDVITIWMEALSDPDSPRLIDTYLFLLSDDGTVLAEDDDGWEDTNSRIQEFLLPADGTYTIVATSYTREERGWYELTLDLVGRQSRRIEYAGMTGYGGAVDGELTPDVPAHIWEFEGQEGDHITIEMDALGGELDPYLLLLAMSEDDLLALLELSDDDLEFLEAYTTDTGSFLAGDDDGGGDLNSLIATQLPADGTYYVVATSCCTAGSSGEYLLALDFVPGAEPSAEQPPDDDTPYIPETTQVIEPEVSSRYLESVSPDASTIVFAEAVYDDRGRAFEVDEVLVIEPTEEAPYGLLRKVVGVNRSQGRVVLETEQASLEEAIYNGAAQVSVTLTPEGAYVAEAGSGRLLSKPAGSAAEEAFTIPIPDEEIVPGVIASGEIELKPSFEFDMVIERSDLRRLILINTTEQSGELRLTAESGFSISLAEEIDLTTLANFGPIEVPVRGTDLSLWLTPVLTVRVGVDGSAVTAITTAVHHTITYHAGVEYENDELRPVAFADGEKTWVEPPNTSARAEARAYVEPELALVVIGGSGPYIGAEGYIRVEASMCETPWWEMFAGVGGSIGVRLQIFSFKFLDEELPIFTEEWPLEDADDPAPFPCPEDGDDAEPPASEPEPPPPADNGGGGGGCCGLFAVVLLGLAATYIGRSNKHPT
jgi:hypothetical protein